MAYTYSNVTMVAKQNLSSKVKLLICIMLCEAVGVVSGLLTSNDITTWFQTLNKPTWNPPGYLFGPVWTVLYLLMGVSLWLIWKSNAPEQDKTKAELIFAVQLFLNFWWSIIFFKFHSLQFAFFDILLMIVTILLTIFSFAPISKIAAWLLVPYIAWVCFASLLNYSIWMLNF